jgi:hypothetical protein
MRWIIWPALAGAAGSTALLGWLLLPGDHPVPDAIWLAHSSGSSRCTAARCTPGSGICERVWVRHCDARYQGQ